MPSQFGGIEVSQPQGSRFGGIPLPPPQQTDQPEHEGFFASLWSALPHPIDAIKDYIQNGPPAKQALDLISSKKPEEMTDEDLQKLTSAGSRADNNLLTLAAAPHVQAARQVKQGDIGGAIGTEIGTDLPLAAPGVFRGAKAAGSAAVSATGKVLETASDPAIREAIGVISPRVKNALAVYQRAKAAKAAYDAAKDAGVEDTELLNGLSKWATGRPFEKLTTDEQAQVRALAARDSAKAGPAAPKSLLPGLRQDVVDLQGGTVLPDQQRYANPATEAANDYASFAARPLQTIPDLVKSRVGPVTMPLSMNGKTFALGKAVEDYMGSARNLPQRTTTPPPDTAVAPTPPVNGTAPPPAPAPAAVPLPTPANGVRLSEVLAKNPKALQIAKQLAAEVNRPDPTELPALGDLLHQLVDNPEMLKKAAMMAARARLDSLRESLINNGR